jgi:hypothetical protein
LSLVQRPPKVGIALTWGALLGALLLWQTSVRASRPDGIDLTSYLLSARALLHGTSPYLLPTPFPYLYPPTLAFLLAPLTMVPSFAALLIWFTLSASAALWATQRVLVSVRPHLARREADLALWLAVLCTFFFTIFQSNLRNGQVNFIVLALCVAAALPRQDRPDRPAPSPHPARPAPPALPALFWSLAIAIKIMPLVLLPYFALRRRWPWLIQTAVFGAAFLLLPAVIVGRRIVDIYVQYSDVLMTSSAAPLLEPLDFSLGGTLSVVTGAPITPALRIGAAVAVLGSVLLADGRRLQADHVRSLALYLLAVPLASPKSEVHHLAFMLPAAAVVAAAWRWSSRPIGRTFLIAGSLAAALYIAATVLPFAKGLMYCAALIASAVAVMNSPPEVDRTAVERQPGVRATAEDAEDAEVQS